ncbi:MAG: hypothetical protein ACR2PX_26760 [Endozoicomonas sp.]|uniref:hypothetical protein n=1 Tax=Endozoicomonas sp. TaxID=1892382 RepID=UPI003D9AC918
MYGVMGNILNQQLTSESENVKSEDAKDLGASSSAVELSEGACLSHRSISTAAPQSVVNPLTSNPLKGLDWLKRCPEGKLVHLLMDGELVVRGQNVRSCHEKEPGCMEAFISGWELVISRLQSMKNGDPVMVDLEFIRDLHSRVAGHDINNQPGEIIKYPVDCFFLPVGHSKFTDVIFLDQSGVIEAQTLHERHCDNIGVPDSCYYERSAFVLLFESNPPLRPFPLSVDSTLELLKCREDPQVMFTALEHIITSSTAEGEEMREYFTALQAHQYPGQLPFILQRQMDAFMQQISLLLCEDFNCLLRRKTVDSDCVEEILIDIIHSLNSCLAKLNSKDMLIAEIVSHISEMSQIHPFKDCNSRAFTLLMQYILMSFGFPPASLELSKAMRLNCQASKVKALNEALEITETIAAEAEVEQSPIKEPYSRKLCKGFKELIGSSNDANKKASA